MLWCSTGCWVICSLAARWHFLHFAVGGLRPQLNMQGGHIKLMATNESMCMRQEGSIFNGGMVLYGSELFIETLLQGWIW